MGLQQQTETLGMYLLPPFVSNPALADHYQYDYEQVVSDIWGLPEEEAIYYIRDMVCNDLFFCLYYILGRTDINNGDKPFIVDRIAEVQTGPKTDTVDLWARGHYKSSIITNGLTIQDHCNDKNLRIGIFSHTRPIAKGFMLPIKTAYESSEILKLVFKDIFWADPRKEAPSWSMDDGLTLKVDSASNTKSLEAWGLVDGMPTSKHFGLRIYDDVVTDKSVGTPDMIKKAGDAMRLSDNLSTTDGSGRQRIIGTIYSHGDYYTDCIRDYNNGTYPWAVRIYPWFRPGSITEDAESINMMSDDEIDNISCYMPASLIREKYRKQGPYIFACQMELDPTNEEMREFKQSWLRRYSKLPNKRTKYILVDPANEKKKESDYTVIALVSVCSQGNRYLEDMVRAKMDLGERWRAIRDMVRDNPGAREVWYEKYGKDSDIWYMEQKQQEEGVYFKINAIGGSTSKIDRIRRLIPTCNNGQFYLPLVGIIRDGVDLVQIFLDEEYDVFPYCVHFDMLDAISRIEDPEVAATPPLGSVEEKLAEASREQMLAEREEEYT